MMSEKNMSSEEGPAPVETPKGENYRAVIDTEICTVSGECMKVCEPVAIHEGPGRLPLVCVCAAAPATELLPGKSVVDPDKCTGCGDCIAVCPVQAIQMVPVSEAYG